MIDPLIVGFGLGVGLLIGLTGIGGGSLMTPLLILFAGIQPVIAVGTDLAYGAITKTVGGWRHLRQGTVDVGLSMWLAVGSVPGALLGALAIDGLHARFGRAADEVLLLAIAVTLVVVGGATLLRIVIVPDAAASEHERFVATKRMRGVAAAVGLVVGLLVGATSVGSGALIGLALILVFRLVPHRVVGTDIFHAAILLWVAAGAHWSSGNVDLELMGNILLGSIPGVLVGTRYVMRVPSAGLRPVLGCVLLASALALFKKSGMAVPAWSIPVLPLAAGAVVWGMLRSRPAGRRVEG